MTEQPSDNDFVWATRILTMDQEELKRRANAINLAYLQKVADGKIDPPSINSKVSTCTRCGSETFCDVCTASDEEDATEAP